MVSTKQAPGPGTRARNQALTRKGGEQGRAVVSGNFSTSAAARGLFLERQEQMTQENWCVETGKCILTGRTEEEARRIAANICETQGPGEAIAYRAARPKLKRTRPNQDGGPQP
jgi:hypothetical protein